MLIPVLGAHTATAAATRVANPFANATPFLNPDYTAEVQSQASQDTGSLAAAESQVANYPTAVWMDKIAAITGDTTHAGLTTQLDRAESQGANLFEVVIYDLPGRDCAALASNGEIPATQAGLTEYESQYIDPIVSILSQSKYSNLRIAAFIEPDSLPNAVTNQSKSACQTATPFYETGIEYALNKLHAIPNVYNYLDIGHSGWLGWSSNMNPAAQEFAKVAKATTAGVSSIDGFVSDTANNTPSDEPFLTNSTLSIGGQPLDSANFYQWNPEFDEHHYDEDMHSALVSAGFPSSVGMLIDTSRNGWGGSKRPTSLNSSPTNVNDYVNANKVDQRPFRGDWCNVNGAGIGARPQANPYGAGDPIIADVWIKPPGESDGDYPTASHSHGDPHCDPNGTQTDGNGGTYPTDAIPGYDVPAGQWFGYQFQQLVQNAYPAISGSGTTGGSTTGSTTSGTTGSTTSGTTGSTTSGTTGSTTSGTTGSTTSGTTGSTTSGTTGSTTSGTTGSTTSGTTGSTTSGTTGSTTSGTSGSTTGGTGSGCSATYQVASDWGSGFNVNVTVNNTGSKAISSWKVTWTFSGSQKISNMWNANYTQSGASVSASNMTYNGSIAAGGNTSFGFQGTPGAGSVPTVTCSAS
jgi:cellulose 1,4-beta-cellobiosidase